MQYDYNGYTDWNMMLNMKGGPSIVFPADAGVIANAENQEFYKQPIFYMFGHFSKYVKPDSVRIEATLLNSNSHTNITTVAFERPDNIIVVILFNG